MNQTQPPDPPVPPTIETCPKCGQASLRFLPGATRRSCSFCHYVRDPSTSPLEGIPTTPFQQDLAARLPARKKTLDIRQLLLLSLLATALWLAWERLQQEPPGLKGFSAMEQSYHKVTRLFSRKVPAAALERKKLRWQIKREQVVVLHTEVSPCLTVPQDWLANLYAIFEKEMESGQFHFKNNRRILSVSSKFVNSALECLDNYAPGQDTELKLFTHFADNH